MKNLNRLTEEEIGNESLISIEENVPRFSPTMHLEEYLCGSGLTISKFRVDDKERKFE